MAKPNSIKNKEEKENTKQNVLINRIYQAIIKKDIESKKEKNILHIVKTNNNKNFDLTDTNSKSHTNNINLQKSKSVPSKIQTSISKTEIDVEICKSKDTKENIFKFAIQTPVKKTKIVQENTSKNVSSIHARIKSIVGKLCDPVTIVDPAPSTDTKEEIEKDVENEDNEEEQQQQQQEKHKEQEQEQNVNEQDTDDNNILDIDDNNILDTDETRSLASGDDVNNSTDYSVTLRSLFDSSNGASPATAAAAAQTATRKAAPRELGSCLRSRGSFPRRYAAASPRPKIRVRTVSIHRAVRRYQAGESPVRRIGPRVYRTPRKRKRAPTRYSMYPTPPYMYLLKERYCAILEVDGRVANIAEFTDRIKDEWNAMDHDQRTPYYDKASRDFQNDTNMTFYRLEGIFDSN